MDELDIAEERTGIFTDDAIRSVQRKAARFIPGEPGECDKCGEGMPRLVDGWCCRCRDKHKIG